MSYAARADAILVAFSDRIEGAGIAMPQMCAAAWMRLHTPLRQVCTATECGLPKLQFRVATGMQIHSGLDMSLAAACTSQGCAITPASAQC